MPTFPQKLDSDLAFNLAQTMLEGFDKHYRLFREVSLSAKPRFEAAGWKEQQLAQRQRIDFYDARVNECAAALQSQFDAEHQTMRVWQQVKLHYIGLLTNHGQPELAETFSTQ